MQPHGYLCPCRTRIFELPSKSVARTEYFIRNGCENLHPDTLKYYIKALKVRLDKIESGKVLESEEVYLFRTRITSCEQYLNVRVESSPKALSSKISRTADLESREVCSLTHCFFWASNDWGCI